MSITVVSWNVNGIRSVFTKGFVQFLAAQQPDVLCVQETKIQPDQVPETMRHPVKGYDSVWHSALRKGYSSTATFFRHAPRSVNTMGVAEFDDEGRVQVLEFDTFTLVNAYFPNSQEERKRLAYKLRFVEAMTRLLNGLVAQGKNVILSGDYNIAHTAMDLARPDQNENSAGYYIEERQAMERLLSSGMVDTFRHFTREPGHYTWWSYRGGARQRNVGWRIDYHCCNQAMLDRVARSYILPQVTGSDHAPLVIDLRS